MKTAILLVLIAATVLALFFSSRLDDNEERVVATTSTTVLSDRGVPRLPENFASWVEGVNRKPAVRHKATRDVLSVPVGVWDRIAACESGGRWDDTRGGYEGGLHFLNSTWLRAGGGRFAQHAYQATREQQIAVAESWLARTSWAQWPVCSRKVGVR